MYYQQPNTPNVQHFKGAAIHLHPSVETVKNNTSQCYYYYEETNN